MLSSSEFIPCTSAGIAMLDSERITRARLERHYQAQVLETRWILQGMLKPMIDELRCYNPEEKYQLNVRDYVGDSKLLRLCGLNIPVVSGHYFEFNCMRKSPEKVIFEGFYFVPYGSRENPINWLEGAMLLNAPLQNHSVAEFYRMRRQDFFFPGNNKVELYLD